MSIKKRGRGIMSCSVERSRQEDGGVPGGAGSDSGKIQLRSREGRPGSTYGRNCKVIYVGIGILLTAVVGYKEMVGRIEISLSMTD